jgi:hypothetical protein
LSLPEIVAILGPRPFGMKENIREYLEEMKDRDVDEDRALKEAEAAAEAQHRIDQAAKTKFDPNAKEEEEESSENTPVSETDSNDKNATEAELTSEKTGDEKTSDTNETTEEKNKQKESK